MKFSNTLTSNWENAFHGLRHPMESYAKSDSFFGLQVAEFMVDDWSSVVRQDGDLVEYAKLGPNDIDLAQRMIKAGTPNDKFLRQIFVSVDITAPLYWWKEMDTYKVATTANSTSTMHKLASTPITLDCFEMDDFQDFSCHSFTTEEDRQFSDALNDLIKTYENLRLKYLETKDMRYWKELIRWLPESWLQTRTWTANYATLRNIIHWRKGHKLTEWKQFLDWAAALPYANELLLFEN